ncbi:MAG: apolipoprotein N-acyltransferase [Pseudomonadota bacterium]
MMVLLALLLGALLPLAFAPFEYWWLAPLLIAAWVWCWFGASGRRVFWIGFAFGAGAFLTGTYWLYHSIAVIGKAPLALTLFLMLGMVAIMALYFGACAALVKRVCRDDWRSALLMLAPMYTVLEWLRGWVLSGFPWLNLGYTLPESFQSGWLPLGGVHLGSFVLVSFAAGVLWVIKSDGRERVLAALAIVSLALVGGVLSQRQWSVVGDQRVTVRVGQLGLDQELKWRPEQFQATLQWYATFVRDNVDADLLVTPEVALPTLAERVPDYLAQLQQSVRDGDSDLLVGILRRDAQQQVSNALLQLGDGERQWYEKRHLVPYGEFFPVPAFIRAWMKAKGLPFTDLKAGSDQQSPIVAAGHPIATSICYEDAYASEQLLFFPAARFIVNVTNDAWFGDTIAPHQHLQIARTRSTEAQRWQVRAANTGITAIIDDYGRVVKAAPAFEPAVLSGTIEIREGHTPYTLTGDKPVLLLSLVLLGGLIQRKRAGRGTSASVSTEH